jgi:HK97 family phage major capsid protein
MEEKELQALLKDIGAKTKETVTTEIKAALDGVFKVADLEAKFETLGLKSDTIAKLTKMVETQGEEMRKHFEKGVKTENKSWEEVLEEKKEDISKMSNASQNERFKIELPYQRKTLIQRSAAASNTLAMRLPDVGEIAYQGNVISSLFRQASMGQGMNGVIRYMDQNAITRNAATVAEAATKPESAIDWIERLLPIQKIADSIPVTKEAYRDLPFVASEIDRLLNINLALKEDQQLWSGTGVSPQLAGVNTTAGAADLTAFAASIESANIYDLIAAVRVSIMNSKQSKYAPNAVIMNPVDILKYKLTKATDGHYVLPPFVSADGMMIDGIRVVESSQVTANTLLVGDFRYGTQYNLDGITIEMGYVNDQFIKNQWTILAEMRTALLIRNVDADAFKKIVSISASLAALETP